MIKCLLLNGLKSVDFGFFIGCAVVIGLIIAVYYLIPVFNKKQYAEQRENLKKREAAFNSNRKSEDVEDDNVSSENDSLIKVDSQGVELSAQLDNLSDNSELEAVEALSDNQEVNGENNDL